MEKGKNRYISCLLAICFFCSCVRAELEESVEEDTSHGLVGTYYNNLDFTDQALVRRDAQVDFHWGSGSPDSVIGADTFSVRWEGFVQPEFSETYTFSTRSDDGARLWVNGEQIIDDWTPHPPPPQTRSGTIDLEAGRFYPIVLEYYENGGGASIELSWSSPSVGQQIIPSSQLSTEISDDDGDVPSSQLPTEISDDDGDGEMHCAEVNEWQTAQLQCSDGRITSIEFASYGTPTGTCQSGYSIDQGCHAESSLSVVEEACLGQESCIVLASNETFGDPCQGTFKHFRVMFTCSGSEDDDREGAPAPEVEIRHAVIVRVTSRDSTPTLSLEQLEEYIMGDSAPTLRSQFDNCSAGQVLFEGEFLDVYVDMESRGVVPSNVRGAAQQVVEEEYPGKLEEADNIMYCLPPGAPPGFYAVSGGKVSWYNDVWCASLCGLMHEVGHSLGLQHSAYNGSAYGDATGYMGAGGSTPNSPSKCFNGAHHWALGWYEARRLEVQPSTEGVLVDLAAFTDYWVTNPDEPVIVKVGESLFLQYNRAETFNSETGAMRDSVTIVEFTGTGLTDLLGELNEANPRFTMDDFAENGSTLIVDLCERVDGASGVPDIMRLSIGLDDSLCGE